MKLFKWFKDLDNKYKLYRRNKTAVDIAMSIIDRLNITQSKHTLHFTLVMSVDDLSKHHGPRIPFAFMAKWDGLYLVHTGSSPVKMTKMTKDIELEGRTPDTSFKFTVNEDGVLNPVYITRIIEEETK